MRWRGTLALVLGVLVASPDARSVLEPATLCAVGDMHGDATHAFDALRFCGAVDESGRWIGGRMTVVQTGDVVDRGNASLPLLHALWALREQAATAGGELLLLMGNHELLNLQGATRYVHSEELVAHGGVAAWQQLMDPKRGDIGQRLATQPGVAVRGDGTCRTLFLHAGLRLSTARTYASLDALNEALSQQATANDGELLDARDGPLWFRGYARPHSSGLSEQQSCAEAEAALAALGDGAVRMTVGHNIVPFVSTRCGGTVHMIDVGMSTAYEGRPAAWRCSLDPQTSKAVVRAVYAAGEEEPPDLCMACSEVLSTLRRSSGSGPLRGLDPHGDCRNYCHQSARTRPARGLSSGSTLGSGLKALLSSWGATEPPQVPELVENTNHVKTEF